MPTGDKAMGRGFFMKGRRPEMRVLAYVAGVLPRRVGDVFVDVGANIGTTTIPALVQHGFARAVAVEPEPGNVRLLKANLALNGLDDRVSVVAAGAGREAGTATMALSKVNVGGHRMIAAGERILEEKAVRVPVLALDDMPEIPVGDVGLLWMDVQGLEGHVLAGASRLLARGVPLVFEFEPGGLRNVDGLDMLVDAVTGSYSHVYDARGRDTEPRPVREALEEAAQADGVRDFLAVRL